MKGKFTQAKYRTKKGCGCKLCKPHKGGRENRRTVKDRKQAIDHEQQLKDLQ